MTNKAQTSTQTAPAKAGQLRLERTFNATPERLWEHWTDPKKYAKWLSPQKADLVIHEWDLRVGGRVRFDMPLDNGQVNKEEGVFHVLDKPRHLATGNADKTFVLDVTFHAEDGGQRTRLVVVIDGVPPEWHAPAREGWGVGFGKLDRLLTVPAGVSDAATGYVRDRVVYLERWFKAPPEKVFAAWGSAQLLPQFFWPVGTGKIVKLDFRKGGSLEMAHATQPWTAKWEFLDIVPNRKIAIRDVWPDGSGLTATGTMEFLPDNGGTRMKVVFGPFPSEGPYQPEAAVGGMGMVADRLAEQVEVPGPGDGFRIVRFLSAPPHKVWDLWTTKAGLDKWWKLSAKDMGYEFTVSKLDVREGGAYDLVMRNKEHGELHNHGVYSEVTTHKRLAYRWDFDIFLAPGEKPYPIAVSIDFEEVPTMDPQHPVGTKMTFTQGPMAKPEFTEGSRQGVRSNFAKLESALA